MTLLKLILRPWRRELGSQILTLLASSTLLLLMVFLGGLEHGLERWLKGFSAEQTVAVFVKPNLEEAEIQKIDAALKAILPGELEWISSSRYLEEADQFAPELAQQVKELGDEGKALLPLHFRWHGEAVDADFEQIRKISGVEQVETTAIQRRASVRAYQSLIWVIRMLSMGVALAIAVGFFHLARLNTQLLSDVMRLLKSWGANRFSQRLPSALSIAVMGCAAGLLAAVSWWIFIPRMMRGFQGWIPGLNDAHWIAPFLSTSLFPAVCLLSGIGLGLVSSAAVWVGLGDRS